MLPQLTVLEDFGELRALVILYSRDHLESNGHMERTNQSAESSPSDVSLLNILFPVHSWFGSTMPTTRYSPLPRGDLPS